ncbi:uncharacterized protein LOC130713070 [Lotus japonicus]|uniref:uncharacterized protein LOC130713070 n=1 Tax=Lotus japonicus TaxID=34305 RepID=UPI00258A139E|nr:uncharacterized protein LOC130713070 [Lotus japonicus]
MKTAKKTVLEGWNNTDEAEGSWNVYVARSKACKRHLLTWQKKTFSAADKEIGKLKQELAFINDQPHDIIDWGQVAGLKARINQLLKQEEMYWGMRSRIKWAKWGDRNTKFFHASTIQRRDVNRLEKLKDDSGNWLDGQDTIMKLFVKHYQDIYTRGEVQGIEDCLKDLNITVPPSLNEELCKSITDEEIKDAVECLGSLKAPGPDEINETVVTLIPKIPNPDSTTHYRPISCCNFTYKVISRIMVSRLKGGLNHIITPNQSAFVGGGGRMIQDNIMIAQEAFHNILKKGRESKDHIAIKLDMSKAYERVEWSFLEKTLHAFGFNSHLIDLIMNLVRGVTYKLKINGYLSQKITPQRGLRQGDPLSPYLFVLCADILSHMLRKAQEKGSIQGIKLAPTAPSLTHLFFADDSLLFMRATSQEAYHLINLLNTFSLASGQRINIQESGLICNRALEHQRGGQLASILNIQVWESPGVYLGLPAIWGRNKTHSLAWLKDRIEGKMTGWKEVLLNQAGKEILIKAVIQAIPTYAMAIIKFPKGFCDSLNSMVSRFWWKGQHNQRGIHWKKWEVLTKRKLDGGMGFRDFSLQNLAHLANQAWRLLSNPEALWAKILKAIYYPDSDFLEATKPRRTSWMWTSLLDGCDFLKTHGRWAIAKGDNINVWEDKWLWNGENLHQWSNGQPLKVSTLIDTSTGKWDEVKINALLPSTQALKVLQTPKGLVEEKDRFFWPHHPSGTYSVKSGYQTSRMMVPVPTELAGPSRMIPTELWTAIWSSPVPPKIKHFIWKACHNAVAVKHNLHRRRISTSDLCPVCNREPETIEHTLLLCPWTRAVWCGSPLQLTICTNITSFDEWLILVLNRLSSPNSLDKGLSLLFYTLWTIWKDRNKAAFSNENPNPGNAIRQAQSLLQDCIQAENDSNKKDNHSSMGRRIQNCNAWKAPTRGMIKLNTDATWVSTSLSCSLATIARNHSGRVLTGTVSHLLCPTPLAAEASAVREALILASNLGWGDIWIESDCLQLIEACNKKRQVGEIQILTDDITKLSNNFLHCKFSWIPRRVNCVAHSIANLHNRHLLPPNWLFTPPQQIAAQLRKDSLPFVAEPD